MTDRRCLLYAASLLLCLPLCTLRAQQDKRAEILMHYKQAEAALSKGQPEIARAEFQAILKLDPNNAQTYANLGVIAFKQNDYGQAKPLFEKALQRNGALWDAKALLGLCEVRLGNAAPGLALLEDVFPHVQNPDVKLDTGIAIITAHQETKTLSSVVAVIRDLEATMPANPEVLYVAYRAYSELASEQLGALAKAAPDSARTHQVYGEASLTQDDFASAIAEFRKASEIDPELPGIHYQLGLALLTNSQDAPARKEAQAAFEAELKRDPSDFHSEYELGEVYRLGLQLPQAEEHYRRALKLRPALAEAQIGIGTVLTQEGKSEESVRPLLEATRLDPDNEIAHYRLSKTYRTLGRIPEANRELASFQKLHATHEVRTSKTREDDPERGVVLPKE